MAAPLTLGAAADMINPAVQKMFLKFAPKHEESWRKFYNITTGVTDYNLIDSSLSGLGEAARITENAVIVSEAPVQGFDKTYTQIEYGKIMSFTKKMWKFGIKKRDMTRIVSALKQACIDKRQRLLLEKLDAAWLTSYTHSDDAGNFSLTVTGGDALALASASHTREDGSWFNIFPILAAI